MRALLRTSDSPLELVLRLTLAVVFFPHGAQKVLGWFGGFGLARTMAHFTTDLHLPALLAGLAIAAEFLGAIALFFGLLTRVAAFGLFIDMLVAAVLAHVKVGFFMNWLGRYPAGQEGFEFHLLALALLLAVMVRGAVALSVDRLLNRVYERADSLPRHGVQMVSLHARTTLTGLY